MPETVEAVIRAYYAAFNAGDAAAFLDLLTEDVVHDINQAAGKSASRHLPRSSRR